jgi:NAD(P)-dependent dehydrogenase (short-subunit alcohol dehydrogenase family)
MTNRLALITGGMGGLGETISTKMVDAGYRVAVTYSPANKMSAKWLADMQHRGYACRAYGCDVTRGRRSLSVGRRHRARGHRRARRHEPGCSVWEKST